MFKNALISVSDKTGLVDFLRPFYEKGMRIVSTGGTAEHLRQNGLSVIDVSEQTGFPEVMDGRVKTLHPHIHMALLSRNGNQADEALLKERNLEPFDLLVCNLYPFEESLKKGLSGQDLIEKIDIGGPSLIRASCKNFERISTVCDPKDYEWILKKENLLLEDRKRLAAKAFAHTSSYDSIISQSFFNEESIEGRSELTLAGRQYLSLRYGENPEQKAAWYQSLGNEKGLHSAEILQGKTLSYNNLLDLDAASLLLKELSGESTFHPAAVVVKHNNPCGVAIADSLESAIQKALQADPISAFGGIIALNGKVSDIEAKIMSSLFVECIVAPDFTRKALDIFSEKKNLRLLKWPNLITSKNKYDIKSINGGFLIQESDSFQSNKNQWTFHGEQPSNDILKDLLFAEKICASLKSNAIAIIKNEQSLGLGMGQVNRVDAVNQAIERQKKFHPDQKNLVLSSDAFFPFTDSIEIAHKAGVKWIIQPGGSVKDKDVILMCKTLGINLIFTGKRHFRH